jgi:DNA-binding beta-propeller fold protein YncE
MLSPNEQKEENHTLKRHARKGIPMFKARICCLFLLGLALPAIFSLMQAHADGGAPNLAYVAGASQGVGIIDVAQQRVIGGLAVAGDPYTILLSPDGRLLYVTQPTLGQVTALATKTRQAICSAPFPGHPSLLALSSDGTVLYVAGMNETTIIALDSQTCVLRSSFQTTEPISWLAVTGVSTSNALHTQLWVAGMTAVSILDEQGHVLDSIPIEGGPRFLCLPGALTAYVTTRQGSVVAVDMLTHQVFASLLTGGTFGPMDYDAVTGDIYVPDQQHNQVDVLSPVLDGSGLTPQEPEHIIRLSSSPQAIAITSDGQLGFVALSGGNVDMLDIPGRSIVTTMFVGGRPHFIITGPYPPPGVPTPQLAAVSPPNTTFWVLIVAPIIGVLLGASWFIWRHRKGRAPKI